MVQKSRGVRIKKSILSQAWWCLPIIPATQEAEAGESPEPRRWRLQWVKIKPLHSCLGDRQTVSKIPATWETEAGESLEPRSWRLQWAEIVPLHASLDDRVRLCVQKKKKEIKFKKVKISSGSPIYNVPHTEVSDVTHWEWPWQRSKQHLFDT